MWDFETLSGPPLREASDVGALTLGQVLADQCAQHPDHEALVFDDPLVGETVRWTYRDLADQARRIAKALLARGTCKGARVGILMGNRPEAVASLFGAVLAGAVAVPLSTFSPGPELSYLVSHSDVSVLLLQTSMGRRRFAADLVGLCPGAAGSRPIRDPAYPSLRHAAALGPSTDRANIQAWEAFLERGDAVGDALLDAVTAQVDPSDSATIIYSSGTTDRPKGVLHSHESVALQWWIQAKLFGRDAATRVWSPLPLFWTAGLNAAMGATIAAGGTWVMQEQFEPGHALRLLERERVTEPHAFAHQARTLAEHPTWPSTDLSSCTRVYGKSVFTRHPTVKGDMTWNMPVGYGMSETASFLAGFSSDTPRELLRGGSYGRLLPGSQLRVIDPDTGRALPAREEGELIVRGPTLMEHYVKRTRSQCFDLEGFFHTGDRGFYDEDGNIYFSGRATEMIKTGGANVSPAEIELQLHAFEPAKLARAIGVDDRRLGQIVVLCVELKDGSTATELDIRSFLRERLASYKVPKKVLFFADGEIPLNGSGTKVQDGRLIVMAQDRLHS
ncbi:class I adenylate-forming enzyme family protein [Pseudofrankia asymbiotica]|uniref:AMP-dependent synthetase n=1 Tax=Pseudofrankia asymbiotica TaxID=1834516 RepID=A0A1V2HYU8_9ACTN|nr:class I adenylate-forming enzyme family protein [Pseudofrankia asymbiotica]ONH21765.1 AMP-dependent synthetase [Pseudofrankia asymbiotica]ONH27164.1 AMP-dependent synthetase [Pseudofrankia asymbiotica]